MHNFKSILCILTSLCITAGVCSLRQFLNYVIERKDSVDVLTALSFMVIFGFVASHKTVQKLIQDHPVKEYCIRHKEDLGLSIVISATFFTVKSFHLSFYDFENSLSSMYTAFVLAIISIFVIYGKRNAPSSTVLFSVAYTSLILSFLGLAMTVTPSMMDPAFVVAFTATFSLVVGIVLFLLNTTRSEKIVDGIFCGNTRLMRPSEVLEQLQDEAEEEEADEVFSDGVEENAEGEDTFIGNPFLLGKQGEQEKDDEKLRDTEAELMTQSIIDDLADQIQTINGCVDFLNAKLNKK